MKSLKGNKNKYQVDDIDNVYDVVDEKSYTKKVLDRQCDDWIVDGNIFYTKKLFYNLQIKIMKKQ